MYSSTGSVDADYITVDASDENDELISVIVSGDAKRLVVIEDDWDAFGRLRTRLDALKTLGQESARLIDRLAADGIRTPEVIQQATRAGNELKALANDPGAEIASAVFDLTGAPATDARYGLDRHWRNVRTHAANVANRWRYHQIGVSSLSDLPDTSTARAQIAARERGVNS